MSTFDVLTAIQDSALAHAISKSDRIFLREVIPWPWNLRFRVAKSRCVVLLAVRSSVFPPYFE